MNFKHFALIFSGLVLLASCDEDENTAANQDNANANPSVIPEALNLEMPRLDGQAGDFYAHYATDARGTRTLNYTLEWCPEKKHSRWVAFIFTNTTAATNWNRDNWKGAEWEGQVWDGDPFQPDPDIPAGQRSELSDFRGSGYQRGHLCASADRLFSKDANGQTFYLSNMSPQTGPFNVDDWGDLENQVRNWGRNSSFRDTLFVVKGGTIAEGQTLGTIGSGVAVPKYYFMALLCKKYSSGQNTYQAIGFWVEHKSYGGNADLRSWAVSIDELEEKTGIDFFCNLPDRVEIPVEQTCNPGNWTGL